MKTLLQMSAVFAILLGATGARAEYIDREASSLQAMQEAREDAERMVYGGEDYGYGGVESYSDILIRESSREETQSCMGQGHQGRRVTIRTYRRDNGTTYDSTDYGFWSGCRV